MGSFSGIGVPLQVIALCSLEDSLAFDVQFGGRLSRSTEKTPFHLLKIIGFLEEGPDSLWYLDLSPLLLAQGSWRLWLYGGAPIKFLQRNKGSGGGLMQRIRRRLFPFFVSLLIMPGDFSFLKSIISKKLDFDLVYFVSMCRIFFMHMVRGLHINMDL